MAWGVFSLQAIVLGISLVAVLSEPHPAEPGSNFPPTKWLSLAQLIAIAVLSGITAFRMYFRWRSYLFWLLVGVGFLYLAGETVWRVNERIESRIEDIAQMSDESWTRRIDDALVLLAGMCGVAILMYYWRSLARLRPARSLYAAGFAVLLLMSAWDLLIGQWSLIAAAVGIAPGALTGSKELVYSILELFEDALMLIGEGLFLIATWWCLTSEVPSHTD